jgi:SNF2 family DNA or RNA helicase
MAFIPNSLPNMDHASSPIDWQGSLDWPTALPVETVAFGSDIVSPAIVSATFRKRRQKVSSYFFSATGVAESESKNDSPSPTHFFQPSADSVVDVIPAEFSKQNQVTKDDKRTHLRAPKDVIKMGDRLFYMLQPPLESLLSGETMEFPFPPFDFQYAGVGFLFTRYNAILADEMGLGKTMQAITSIRMLLRTRQATNILLICPKPLVTNWLREFKTWAPEITVAAIQGNKNERAWHWKHNRAMVKVANYELLIRDEAHVTSDQLQYDLCVLDEAQRVKNKQNSTSKVVRKINRRRSWALTGTPIENSINDLVGICEFASPGLVHQNMTAREIKRNVSDLILRRTKDLVMTDMPPRLMRDAELDLSQEQSDQYFAAENNGVMQLGEMGDEITINHVFELVLRLKQICNFDPVTGASTKVDRLKADLEEVAASGQKAIVFSQWVGAIEKVADQVQRFNPLQYHGRIPSKRRDPILQEFKENPDRTVLLMSYGAGSVGLNLQFCRYVFLFDRWWNPAVEDQAINRAHRIGAAGSVTITRMIMAGTIEQRIHDVLEEKRALFNEILSPDTQPTNRGLSREEIFGLFDLTTPQGKIANPAA